MVGYYKIHLHLFSHKVKSFKMNLC